MAKKFKLKLVGQDGNAFVLLGFFQSRATKAGWTQKEIDKVLGEATTGDYNHLVTTLMDASTDPDSILSQEN